MKKQNILIVLAGIAFALIILGLLFLVNAMGVASFFSAFSLIDNVLIKYIVVIVTMACGIMLMSNVTSRIEDDRLRVGSTIAITTFSTILTVPLVYVFVAIFPAAANGTIGPVGKIMTLDKILEGFVDWFGDGAFLYVVFAFMLVLSIVFITVPLLMGILTARGKTIEVAIIDKKLKISIGTLPVLKNRQSAVTEKDQVTDNKEI